MSSPPTKSFFQRPEGKTSIVFMIAAMAGLGYGLYKLMPYVVELLKNTLYAISLAAAIAFFVFVISDKRVRTLASYGWKSLMRFITGLIVEIDPIGILKGYAEDLNARLEEMKKSMASLNGQTVRLKSIIDKNEADRTKSLQIAKQAHDKADMKPAFILQSRQAGRLQKSNITLQALYNKMQAMLKAMRKYYDVSEFTVRDIEGEIEVKTQERAAIKASYGAFTSARKILQGEGDQRALFDQAMEHLADDYAMKIGEIELFMDMSEGFIKTMDLENGVYEQDALDQFEEWERKADKLLISPDPAAKTRVAVSAPGESEEEIEARAVEEAASSEFADLFESPNSKR
jgi:hypothetical protein